MARTQYSKLLICDTAFFDKHVASSPTTQLKLMHINMKSRQHHRKHVRISGRSFEEIQKKSPSYQKHVDLIRAAIKPIDYPEVDNIEKEEDEVERTVLHAINMSSSPPYDVVILTTDEKSEEYLKNAHFIKMKEVSVKTDDIALRLIDQMYLAGMENQDLC